jgi:hypothetical protein
MITVSNHTRHFDGYKINSTLKRNKKTFEHDLNPLHLEKTIAVLNQAKHSMLQPMVGHLTIFINDSFQCTTLIPRLKRVLKDDSLLFAYSIEKANKLHIHLMLVLDCRNQNPATVFYLKVLPVILALKNVEGCDLNGRWKHKQNGTAKYYHDLKLDHEFRDAVERYSYMAKTNDKKGIPATIKKTFATSQIKHNKYYAILGTSNMLKIKPIQKNEKLQFSNDLKLNQKYLNFRKCRVTPESHKRMFHFVDTANNNKSIGFYGYSYDCESFDDLYVLSVEIDDLYLDSAYIDSDTNMSHFDSLYLHLRSEVSRLILTAKDAMTSDQKLMVNAVAHFNEMLEEMLIMIVTAECLEHSIALYEFSSLSADV